MTTFTFTISYIYLGNRMDICIDEDEPLYILPGKKFLKDICRITQCSQATLQKRLDADEPLYTSHSDDAHGIRALLWLQLWCSQNNYDFVLQKDGAECSYKDLLAGLDDLNEKPDKNYLAAQGRYNAHLKRIRRTILREMHNKDKDLQDDSLRDLFTAL